MHPSLKTHKIFSAYSIYPVKILKQKLMKLIFYDLLIISTVKNRDYTRFESHHKIIQNNHGSVWVNLANLSLTFQTIVY